MSQITKLPTKIGRDLLVDILDSMYDGVYCMNRDGNIIFWNTTAEELTGFSSGEVIGKSCSDCILQHVSDSGHEMCSTFCPLKQTINDGKKRECLAYMHHKKGHRIPILIRTSPLYNEQGDIIAGIEVFSDTKVLQTLASRNQQLKSIAFIDTLTELPNRRFGEQKLAEAFFNFQRYNHNFSLAIFDIDNFKDFNDNYGHNFGDQVLKMTSQTLLYGSRKSDFICRWGGEEFLAIFIEADEENIFVVADRQRMLVESSYLSTANNENLSITISGGVAYSKDADSIDKLLQIADTNLYISKKSGKNQITA